MFWVVLLSSRVLSGLICGMEVLICCDDEFHIRREAWELICFMTTFHAIPLQGRSHKGASCWSMNMLPGVLAGIFVSLTMVLAARACGLLTWKENKNATRRRSLPAQAKSAGKRQREYGKHGWYFCLLPTTSDRERFLGQSITCGNEP